MQYVYYYIEPNGDYNCDIRAKSIPAIISKIIGKHKPGKSNEDVNSVSFYECDIERIPQGLTKIYPNITKLRISNSSLKTVKKNDLIEYKNIKELTFDGNQIEFLPSDLFEGFQKLEHISFMRNKIKIIEPGILDGLDKLKHVDFSENVNYNLLYSSRQSFKVNATLKEVKTKLFDIFWKNLETYKHVIIKNFEAKQQIAKNLRNPKNPQHSLLIDIKNCFNKNENFCDLKIKIGNHEFNAHKFILAARSPTLANILQNNPDIKDLNLTHISVEIFKKILKFLYTDELPNEDETNFLHLFAAAELLKIEELKDFAGTKICDQINDKNVLEIVKLSIKFNHEELKQKCFNEIKKKHPEIEFNDKMVNDPEKIDKIIEFIKRKEELLKNLKYEYEGLTKKMKI